MSTSPRIRATGLPSWSSNWTSASIGGPRQHSPEFNSRARGFATHRHVVHQRLHQLQPAAAILPARGTPRSVVAHAHGHILVTAHRLEVEAGLAGRVSMLDRVRARLAGRKRDVVERFGIHAYF